MSFWTFTIVGDPVPQPRPRVSTVGGFARAYVPANHPIHAFRKMVEIAAINAGIRSYMGGPIEAVIVCLFERPKGHLNKAGQVKPKHASAIPKGDVDNLAKAVLDALNDHIGDDKRVTDLTVRKRWARPGIRGFTVVTLAEAKSMSEVQQEAA